MNLAAIARVAVNVERNTGFPARALIAQWAAESGWGEKETGAHNMWGLTCAVAPGRPQAWCATTEILTEKQIADLDPQERARVRRIKRRMDGRFEVDLDRRFPCFDSLEQAALRYVALITNGGPYATAWAMYQMDYDLNQLLTGIAKAGYATGAGYGSLLREIAGQHNVQEALRVARGASQVG